MSNNELGGTLPSGFPSIGNGRLAQLYIDNNNFSGVFPGSWEPLSFMEQLHIHNNPFTSYAPRVCLLSVWSGGEATGFETDCRICICGVPFCRTPFCKF